MNTGGLKCHLKVNFVFSRSEVGRLETMIRERVSLNSDQCDSISLSACNAQLSVPVAGISRSCVHAKSYILARVCLKVHLIKADDRGRCASI